MRTFKTKSSLLIKEKCCKRKTTMPKLKISAMDETSVRAEEESSRVALKDTPKHHPDDKDDLENQSHINSGVMGDFDNSHD